MNRNLFSLGLAALIGCSLSCHKDSQTSASHLLGNQFPGNPVLINQASEIYDSTALYDSLLFALPPTDRNYRWTVTPDSGAAVFGDDYLHGRAQISFKAGGAYQISAAVYDSASNKEIARTNTITIQVGSDTLYPETAITKGDQLAISGANFGHESADTNVNDYVFELEFATTDNYYVGSVIPFQLNTGSGIVVNFADSASLPFYPFNVYNAAVAPVQTYISLPKLPVGSSQSFSVIWLGQTYTGTLSRPNSGQLAFTWDNSQPVKIVHQGIIQ